jgi:hypothetical protein
MVASRPSQVAPSTAFAGAIKVALAKIRLEINETLNPSFAQDRFNFMSKFTYPR